MARIDEQRKQRLEQALRDMGNYGVKLRKPEELPDFDQPIDMKRKRKDLSLFKWRIWKKGIATRCSSKRHVKKQNCLQWNKQLLLKKLTGEWAKPRSESI